MIVEAKREGVYFDLPQGFTNRRYKLKTLIDDVPDLGEAIGQVAGYCQQSGTPFAVVTNGHQLVAFIASRQDGLAPTGGDAFVFESLSAAQDDFRTFWDLFSKPGVVERNLQKKLLQGDTPILPQKLSETVTQFPGQKNRNVLQTNLQILADLVFEDIAGSQELEEQFLGKCYCQSGALSQYALISKTLLSSRYEALFESTDTQPTLVPARDKKGVSKELIAESFSRRPILLLGDVGVGKTMFFRHFIHVDAKELFTNAMILYVDFGTRAAFAKDIRDFTLSEIRRQLSRDHAVDILENGFVRGVYHGDLQQFSRGIYGPLKTSDLDEYRRKEISFLEEKLNDKEQHCIAALTHLTKARKKQIIVFLDNADQRSDSVQQQVFMVAEGIASQWPATVFLALRPETFYRSKECGSLSAYHLKAFTVAPPRVDEVLNKRLEFGTAIADGSLTSTALPPGIHVDFATVGKFLTIVKYSFEKSTELLEAVDNLSGGNIRLALDFTKRLISSGHIDTRKIMDVYETQGRYLVKLHEFLRTVTFGDCAYYDPTTSPVFNVFDVSTTDPKEHFLRLMALHRISSEGRRSKHHGFVDVGNLYDFFQGQGFAIPQIDWAICSMTASKLIESAGRVRPLTGSVADSSVRITTIGAYHLQRLAFMFVYYDAIATDLTVLDSSVREQIHDTDDIRERLSRAEVILKYFDTCSVHVDEHASGFVWSAMANGARSNIAEIQQHIR